MPTDLEQKVLSLAAPELDANTLGEILRGHLFDVANRFGYSWETRPEVEGVPIGDDEKKEILDRLYMIDDEFGYGSPQELDWAIAANKEIIGMSHVFKTNIDSETELIAAWYADGDMQFALEVTDTSSGETIRLYNSDAKKNYCWKFLDGSYPL